MVMGIIFFLLCLPTFCLVLASPDDEVCQSILEVTSSSTEPDCQPLGDCTGLSCYSSTSNKTVEITVNKCTDPLVVNVTVYDKAGNLIVSEQVSATGTIGDSSYRIDVLTRDELTATILISYSNGDDSYVPAVPSVSIPLNASLCMCKAIKHAGDNVEAPSSVTCTPNHDTECTGQECQFTVFFSTYYLETEVIACNNPPGFEFIVRDSSKSVVWEEYYDSDTNGTILGLFELQVTVLQKPFSIVAAGRMLYNNQWYNVVPKTQIILDKAECIVPTDTTISTGTVIVTTGNTDTTTTITTIIPTAVPQPQRIGPKTCTAIERIKDEVNSGGLIVCTVVDECSTLSCVTLGLYTSSFELLPCHDPPAIHTVLYDQDTKIYDSVLTNTTDIPVSSNGNTLRIGLDQKEDAIAFKLDVDLGFSFFPVIEERDIPIDTCYCSTEVNCTNSSSSFIISLPTTTGNINMQTTNYNSGLGSWSTTLRGESRPTSTEISLPTHPTSTEISSPPLPTFRGQSVEVAVAISVPVVLLSVGVVGIIILLGVLLLVYKLRLKPNNSVAQSAEDSVAFKDMIYSQEDESLSELSLEK